MQRDFRRISLAFEGLNICPLGGGSMGSTTWDIDRNYTAHLLGFDAPVDNSIDCVASRDFATDILSALSIAANVCSSIMPQKKNPWVLEHIKAKAAHVEGCYMSALNVMKNVIYSHCEDMCGESANYLFPGIEEFKVMCELMEVSIKGITVKKEHMLEKARSNFCTVTELANYLVRHDKISFRMAHDIVAGVVAYMTEHNKNADEIGTAEVNPIFEKLFGRKTSMTDEEVRAALDPVKIAYAKKCIGGTAPEEVDRQLNNRQAGLDRDNKELAERVSRVAAAKAELEAAVNQMTA